MSSWSEGDVRDIQKAVLVLVFLINRTHERCRRRQDLIHEDEYGFLRAKLDAFADDIDELAHGKVGRHQVLLLVDGRNIGFLDLFTNDLMLQQD